MIFKFLLLEDFVILTVLLYILNSFFISPLLVEAGTVKFLKLN